MNILDTLPHRCDVVDTITDNKYTLSSVPRFNIVRRLLRRAQESLDNEKPRTPHNSYKKTYTCLESVTYFLLAVVYER